MARGYRPLVLLTVVAVAVAVCLSSMGQRRSGRAASASAQMQRIASGEYAEGPLVVVEGCGASLLFVEYGRDAVSAVSLHGQQQQQQQRLVKALAPGSGPAGLCLFGDRTLAIACYDAHHVLLCDLDSAGPPRRVEVPYPNDMVGDGRGGLFVTSSGAREGGEPFRRGLPPSGGVFHIRAAPDAADTPVARRLALDRPIDYANGIAFDGRTLFVSEHFANRVLLLRYCLDCLDCLDCLKAEAYIDLPRDRAADDPFLGPDGLAYSAGLGGGRLLVAHHGAGRVFVYGLDASPRLVDVWDTPTDHARVTNVCLGADAAYVTTAEGGVFERAFRL
jgi:sugar lactone lactonase YvrE